MLYVLLPAAEVCVPAIVSVVLVRYCTALQGLFKSVQVALHCACDLTIHSAVHLEEVCKLSQC